MDALYDGKPGSVKKFLKRAKALAKKDRIPFNQKRADQLMEMTKKEKLQHVEFIRQMMDSFRLVSFEKLTPHNIQQHAKFVKNTEAIAVERYGILYNNKLQLAMTAAYYKAGYDHYHSLLRSKIQKLPTAEDAYSLSDIKRYDREVSELRDMAEEYLRIYVNTKYRLYWLRFHPGHVEDKFKQLLENNPEYRNNRGELKNTVESGIRKLIDLLVKKKQSCAARGQDKCVHDIDAFFREKAGM